MKFYVALVGLLICLKGTSSFFYGATTDLPQAKALTSAINKCSTANDKIKSDLCKVVKTTIKFNNDKYKAVSNALTDLEYVFQAMTGFYNTFLNCLTDQNENLSGVVTVRNLEILFYQLDIYVLTGIESKFAFAADALGEVFGSKRKQLFNVIASQFASEFEIIKTSISELTESFQSIVESGNAITIDSINITLSESAFNNMINAFKDIEVTIKQSSSVVTSFVSTTTTLEKVSTNITTSETESTTMVTKGSYNFDIAIQAAKKMFASKALSLQNDIEDSFSDFQLVISQQFSGDSDIFDIRSESENFVISIKAIFGSVLQEFKTFFSSKLQETTNEITILRQSLTELTQRVTEYIAEQVKDNSASFSKCFDQDDFTKGATELIKNLGMKSELCISQQVNISLTAQSLLGFIAEDTVLSVKAHSDRMCACAVKGDKKVKDKAKRCFKRRTQEFDTIVQEETSYIKTEQTKIFEDVTKSLETFKTCRSEITDIFEAAFTKFKNALEACLSFY